MSYVATVRVHSALSAMYVCAHCAILRLMLIAGRDIASLTVLHVAACQVRRSVVSL